MAISKNQIWAYSVVFILLLRPFPIQFDNAQEKIMIPFDNKKNFPFQLIRCNLGYQAKEWERRKVRIQVGNWKYWAISYPPLAEKKIIPVFGYLCRVEMVLGDDSQFQKEIKVKEVPKKDLPPGLTLQRDSFVIPLKGRIFIFDDYIYLEKVEGKPDQGAIAHLANKGRIKEEVLGTAKVKVGDILEINGFGLKVINVVPPNQNTGVIGWMEMDSLVIQKDNLKNQKGPIIHFYSP